MILYLVVEAGLRERYAQLSAASQVAKAVAYSLNRWDALVRATVRQQQRRRAGAARHRCWSAQPDARRLGPGRRAGRRDLYPDRDLQIERGRSAGLARRRAGAIARSPGEANQRTPPLELEDSPPSPSCLNVAAV